MQRLFDMFGLEERVSTLEFVSAAVGEAGVESDILLVVREAPEGDAQLQLLGHRRVHALHQLERDVRGDAAR